MKCSFRWPHYLFDPPPLARVDQYYKKSSPTSALNYRPISVSSCMYTLFASLLLQAMEQPLNRALSPAQAGTKRTHHQCSGIKLMGFPYTTRHPTIRLST